MKVVIFFFHFDILLKFWFKKKIEKVKECKRNKKTKLGLKKFFLNFVCAPVFFFFFFLPKPY